jgi:hypothetical protein
MKHIPKQQWMGCAIASAAMLGDLTYDEVAAHRPDLDPARSRWPEEMCALLKGVTETEWKLTSYWPLFRRPLHRFSFPQWPVAAFIEDAPRGAQLGQWIVVERGVVHDPGERSAYVVSLYPQRDWVITWLAQPVRPAQLASNRARRHMEKVRNILRHEGLDAGSVPRRCGLRAGDIDWAARRRFG